MRVGAKRSSRALAPADASKPDNNTGEDKKEEQKEEVEEEGKQELRRTKRNRVKTKLYSSEEVGSASNSNNNSSNSNRKSDAPLRGPKQFETVRLRKETVLELRRLREEMPSLSISDAGGDEDGDDAVVRRLLASYCQGRSKELQESRQMAVQSVATVAAASTASASSSRATRKSERNAKSEGGEGDESPLKVVVRRNHGEQQKQQQQRRQRRQRQRRQQQQHKQQLQQEQEQQQHQQIVQVNSEVAIPKEAKELETTTKRRRRKRKEKEEKQQHQQQPVEGDPSEKILKRKKISTYDCRKTPLGGLLPSSKEQAGVVEKAQPENGGEGGGEGKDEEEEEDNDDEEGDSLDAVGIEHKDGSKVTSPVASSGGLPPSPAFSLSPKWCRNCDCRHPSGPQSCPLRSPEAVCTDSVIDFSNSSSRDEDEGGDGGGSGGSRQRKEEGARAGEEHEPKHESSSSSSSTSSSSSSSSSSNLVSPDGLDLSRSFAQLSLPSPLRLVEREPGQGLCVVARTTIKARTQFGPLQGERILERDVPEDFDMKDLWQVFTEDNRRLYLSTVNPEKSNWLRYLRPAQNRRERNVAAVVRQTDRLYFVTLGDLSEGDELVYWMDDPDLMWTKKRAEKKNCGGCNARFSHPLYYRLHCTIFHDPQFSLTIRKYHCKVCGLAVLGKDNIVKHALAEHDGKGAYQCQFCKKYFLRLNYLDMHRTYGCSSNPGRARPLCHLCGKKFCQPQKLKLHMRRVHGTGNVALLNDLRCPRCSKLLGSKNALQRHKREVHSEEPSPSAAAAAAAAAAVGAGAGSGIVSAATERSNNNSRASSSNDGSWSGGGGGGGLSSPSSGYLHPQQPDASARVACEKCGRTFKNKSNLKIHMLTHSGVKPFWCKLDGCRSGFTTKQCLQFHYRKAHGLADEEMPKIEREIPYTLSAYSGGMCKEDDEDGRVGGGAVGGGGGGRRVRRGSKLLLTRKGPPPLPSSSSSSLPSAPAPKETKAAATAPSPPRTDVANSASSSSKRDVYRFDEDEEQQLQQQQQQQQPRQQQQQDRLQDPNSPDLITRSADDGSVTNDNSTIDDERHPGGSGKTGMLVLAALNAAEQDMKGLSTDDAERKKAKTGEDDSEEKQALSHTEEESREEEEEHKKEQEQQQQQQQRPQQHEKPLSHSAQSLISKSDDDVGFPPPSAPGPAPAPAPAPPPPPPPSSNESPKEFLPPISSLASSRFPQLHPPHSSASSSSSSSSYAFPADPSSLHPPPPPPHASYGGLYSYPGLDLPPPPARPPAYRSPDYYPTRDYPPPHPPPPSHHASLVDPSSSPHQGLDELPRPPNPFDHFASLSSSLHHPHHPKERDYYQTPVQSSYPSPSAGGGRLPPAATNPYPNPPPPPPPPPPPGSGRLPPLTSNPYHPYGYF